MSIVCPDKDKQKTMLDPLRPLDLLYRMITLKTGEIKIYTCIIYTRLPLSNHHGESAFFTQSLKIYIDL